jgi:endonuclease YncB( thermonuclease family)
MCRVDRYYVSDLAELLSKASGGRYNEDDISQILYDRVNNRRERLASEHAATGFTRGNSVSAFEAYVFIKWRIRFKQYDGNGIYPFIAKNLDSVFFQSGIGKKGIAGTQMVKTREYHDADTVYVAMQMGGDCNTHEATLPIKITGVDAPEVGDYDEKLADAARLKNALGLIYTVVVSPLKPKVEKEGGEEKEDDDWINPKLVAGVDKIHLALSSGRWDPAALSFEEREAMNNIIAATIDFEGKVATLPVEDLRSYGMEATTTGALVMFDSDIRWTSEDTPEVFCGMWQPYDDNGRYIAGFYINDRKRYPEFIRRRLSKLMLEKGDPLYDAYQKKVEVHLNRLKKLPNKELYRQAKAIIDSVKKPSEIYSGEACEKIAKAYEDFKDAHGDYTITDQQILQIITGSVYDYMEYRNQYGELYEAAGNVARENGFGFWNEVTFKTLWDANQNDTRYHPKDCQKA